MANGMSLATASSRYSVDVMSPGLLMQAFLFSLPFGCKDLRTHKQPDIMTGLTVTCPDQFLAPKSRVGGGGGGGGMIVVLLLSTICQPKRRETNRRA